MTAAPPHAPTCSGGVRDAAGLEAGHLQGPPLGGPARECAQVSDQTPPPRAVPGPIAPFCLCVVGLVRSAVPCVADAMCALCLCEAVASAWDAGRAALALPAPADLRSAQLAPGPLLMCLASVFASLPAGTCSGLRTRWACTASGLAWAPAAMPWWSSPWAGRLRSPARRRPTQQCSVRHSRAAWRRAAQPQSETALLGAALLGGCRWAPPRGSSRALVRQLCPPPTNASTCVPLSTPDAALLFPACSLLPLPPFLALFCPFRACLSLLPLFPPNLLWHAVQRPSLPASYPPLP